MANQIEVYEISGQVVRARLLFPRKVEVTMTLAPGDDPGELLKAEHARLTPTYQDKPENPADDPPVEITPAVAVFAGDAWTVEPASLVNVEPAPDA